MFIQPIDQIKSKQKNTPIDQSSKRKKKNHKSQQKREITKKKKKAHKLKEFTMRIHQSTPPTTFTHIVLKRVRDQMEPCWQEEQLYFPLPLE